MTLPAPLAIERIALTVRDLDRVTAFYCDVLGLSVHQNTSGEVHLGAGAQSFLCLRQDRASRPRDPVAAGLYHVAYLLPGRDDLGRWLNHVARTGIQIDGAADHLVSEAVYLQDPEGNGVEVYRDRPRDEWTWQGDQVVMANDRLDIAGLRQADGGWDGAPLGTRIGHVHLQVGDTAQAEQFYAGALGLDVTRRLPRAVFLSSGGYHHHLAVNTWHSAGAGRRDPAAAGLAGITFGATPERFRAMATRNKDVANASPLQDPWGTEFHIVRSS